MPEAKKNPKEGYAAFHEQNLNKEMDMLFNKINEVKLEI